MNPHFGFVGLVVVLYCFLNSWMAMKVGKARRRYKVPFPTMYALESENKDAKMFNCIQRGHQNSLEFMPVFFVLIILSGLQLPRISAVLGLFYTIFRYFYFKGYSTGDPQERLTLGKYSYAALLGLLICTGVSSVRMLADDS
eukprot:c7595_g1_i1 orf=421-846(-)